MSIGNGGRFARLAAVPFERFDQGGLFAANVGARSQVDRDVEIEPFDTRDGQAEEALLAAPLEHRFQMRFEVRVFGPQVDNAVAGAR